VTRILGIEVRRSAALGTVLALLVAGAILLYAAPQRWSAGWMALAMAQREYLVLLWPVALAAGVFQARREHRTHVAELFTSTPRPAAQRVIPVLGAMAIAVVGAYVLVAALGIPWIIDTAGYLPARVFVVLAVGALAMIGGAWLGLAVGRLLPSMVTAPVLAVAGIGLLMVLPAGVGSREWLALIFSPMYGMGQYTDYQTVGGKVSLAQAIWLTALALAAVVLLAAGSWRTRVAALLPAALGATLAIMIIPRDEHVANPIDPVAQELVCADGSPRVCVSRIHTGLLPEVVPPAREALNRLAKLPGAPTAVHEDTTTYHPYVVPKSRPDVVLIEVRADRTGHLAWPGRVLPEIIADAINPLNCPDGVEWAVPRAAAAFLTGEEPKPDRYAVDEPAEINAEAVKLLNGLRALPEQEALARITAVRNARLACKDVEGLLTRSAR